MINEFFTKCATQEFNTNTTKTGTYTIQQTERNKLKAQAIEVFKELIADSLDKLELDSLDISTNVDLTKEGIVISVYNEPLDQEICFILNPVIPSLTYDSQEEANAYQMELQAKAEEKAKKELAKKKKAERDKALREKIAKERAEKRAEREG